MSYTERISEDMAPLVSYNADSLGAGTTTSTYVDMENYHRGWLYLNVGDMQAGATLDVALLQATSAAGAGSKAITGKSITQLTQAGGDGDDLLCIELQSEELDVDGGFKFVAVQVVVANANVELAWTFFGTRSRYKAVPTTNWTEVVG